MCDGAERALVVVGVGAAIGERFDVVDDERTTAAVAWREAEHAATVPDEDAQVVALCLPAATAAARMVSPGLSALVEGAAAAGGDERWALRFEAASHRGDLGPTAAEGERA